MRKVLPLLFVLSFVQSFGQDAVTFKVQFLPAKTYKMDMAIRVESVLNFSGNQETIDKIKANGTTLPITILNLSECSTTTTTGAATAEGRFPAKIAFDKATSTSTDH